jgi:hypothetical protein
MAGFDATFTFHPDSLGVVRAINARRPTSCPRHEHANGLNPARHSEPGGRAYVGTEDVAQKYADYSIGTHEDGYVKFTFNRSDFDFNQLTTSREWFHAPW